MLIESFENWLKHTELNESKESLADWFLNNIDSFSSEKEYMKAGLKAGFSSSELKSVADDFEQGGEDYVRKYNESVNEKNYYIEVSVRDARKALDHLHDVHRGQYKTDGSNYYIFKDEEDAADALSHMENMGIEVLDHNIEESVVYLIEAMTPEEKKARRKERRAARKAGQKLPRLTRGAKAKANASSGKVDKEEAIKAWAQSVMTDDYQGRSGDYPRSGVPVSIDLWKNALLFEFKNTSERIAKSWVERFLSNAGQKAIKISTEQTGDYRDDWVTVEVIMF